MVSGILRMQVFRNMSSGIFMRVFGKKRVVFIDLLVSKLGSLWASCLKYCCGLSHPDSWKGLEALPQYILIRILCGVEHSDFKQLIFVSKTLRNAALIAKKSHFAFNTPLSKPTFRRTFDLDGDSELDTPDAPKRTRICKSRIHGKDIGRIAVALFASDDKDL